MAQGNTKGISNGKLGHTMPEGWETWPTLTEAAARLGAPVRVVKKYMHGGDIQSIIDKDGRRRLNPSDLEGFDEDDLKEEKPKGGLDHDEFRAGTELVRQVHKHHETMVPLIVTGYGQVLAAQEARIQSLVEELKARNERVAALEKERDETAQKREELMSQEYERAAAFRQIEAAEKRKDRALEVLSSKLGPVLMQKLGMSDPRVAVGLEFLQSISREQMLVLVSVGGDMLTAEQRANIMKLLGPLSDEEKEALKSVVTAEPTKEEKP